MSHTGKSTLGKKYTIKDRVYDITESPCQDEGNHNDITSLIIHLHKAIDIVNYKRGYEDAEESQKELATEGKTECHTGIFHKPDIEPAEYFYIFAYGKIQFDIHFKPLVEENSQ